MTEHESASPKSGTRHFFFRGLATILPTVLTLWILIAAYSFIHDRIAEPLNAGLRWSVVSATGYPPVADEELLEFAKIPPAKQAEALRRWSSNRTAPEYLKLLHAAKVAKFTAWWRSYGPLLDLFGVLVAVVLIYIIGALVGSYLGRRLHARGEMFIGRMPLVRYVYPSVKQVTEFFVGEPKSKLKFNRVVAVEYPRRGVWSVGLVTGDTLRNIQARIGANCMTIFVPSSPTPFTGYVITVPRSDTIELPITVEEALRFVISGGVIVPDSQVIDHETDPFITGAADDVPAMVVAPVSPGQTARASEGPTPEDETRTPRESGGTEKPQDRPTPPGDSST